MGGIETRFLFALAALVSAMLHTSLYLGLDFTTPVPVQEVRIEVQDISAFHDTQKMNEQVPESIEPGAQVEEEDAARIHDSELAPSHDDYRQELKDKARNRYHERRPSQVSWRQRLRDKEARHEAAMAEKDAKLAVLQAEKNGRIEMSSTMSTQLYRCGEPQHQPIIARGERDVSRYVGVFPAGLFPNKYVEQMRELFGVKGRGRWSFALPQGSLPIVLDAPKGILLAAGRDERRCVVGVDITPRTFFPLRFLQVPLRIVDPNDKVHASVVDVALSEDGTFRLSRVAGDPLPFTEGALYDHETVGRNLRRHYLGARLLRDVAGVVFGEEP